MKKIYLFFNILLLFSFYKLTAQKYSGYKVIYKLKHDTLHFQPNSNATMEKMEKESDKFAEDLEFILIFNTNESLYAIEKPLKPDDMNPMVYTLGLLQGYLDTIHQYKNSRIKLTRIKNKGKYVWEQDTIFGHRTWKITNETGKLGNYTVIKAIAGKNITAWFTPDIPVPFGPDGEGGLPGLILKIQLGRRIIYANKIIPLKEPIKIPEPKGKRVSAQEMREKRMKEFA